MGKATRPEFTPVQTCMMDVLADGRSHPLGELIACLWDELGTAGTVRVHLCAIRKKIAPERGIVCEQFSGRTYYRLVSLVGTSPYAEVRRALNS